MSDHIDCKLRVEAVPLDRFTPFCDSSLVKVQILPPPALSALAPNSKLGDGADGWMVPEVRRVGGPADRTPGDDLSMARFWSRSWAVGCRP